MKRGSQLKRAWFKKPIKVAFYTKDDDKVLIKAHKIVKVASRTVKTAPRRKIDLKRKAWDTFSRWIRNRDQICITCGSKNANQAGHFWHAVLDFDEMNINGQCHKCNHYLSGNLAPYAVYLINKYGLEKFRDLEVRHYLAMGGEYRTDQDYLDIIDKYELK